MVQKSSVSQYLFSFVDFGVALSEFVSLQLISIYHNFIFTTQLLVNMDLFYSLSKLNVNQTITLIIDRHPHPFFSVTELRTGLLNFSQIFMGSFTETLVDNPNVVVTTSNVRGDFSFGQQAKMLEENTQDFRSVRSQNPVFKPDFKSGNFFTRDDFARKPFLLTTISDITKGMRRPVWFLSDTYSTSLSTLKTNYFNLINASEAPLSGDSKVSSTYIQNPYGIFQTFQMFKTSHIYSTPQGDLDVTYPFINQR
jgi:hypothetical protein